MNDNARDFFFHNRPLETNLDYLKKNETNTEVYWEGTESEFRCNSGIQMCFSQSRQSNFKMNSIKDDEIPSNRSKSPHENMVFKKILTQTENYQTHIPEKQQQEEVKDKVKMDYDLKNNINSLQSPICEKTQQCEISTNQPSNHIDMNIINQYESKSVTPSNQNDEGIRKQEQSVNNNSPHKNSKLISNQQTDLKGDFSPARSSMTNQIKSQTERQQSSNSQNNSQLQQILNSQENQQQQQKNKKEQAEKTKLFKFRTQIESVHEVENWKEYNREDSKENNKKVGCTCAIF